MTVGNRSEVPEKPGPAEPRKFLEINGRRAALLGHETGVFECWMWPIKVCHDLTVNIRTPLAAAAVRGRDCVSRVSVRPDRVVLVYVHQAFTLRQTIFAATDRRAIVMLFEADSPRDLVIEVSFVPDMRTMWPAGLGGQIAAHDAESGAFFLGEELGRFGVLLGSPSAARPGLGADHSLPREAVTISLPWNAKITEPIAFVIAGAETTGPTLSAAAQVGELGAASGFSRIDAVRTAARAEYRRTAEGWLSIRDEAEAHWRSFLGRTAMLRTSDPLVDDAFLWAKIALEKAWVEVDGLGCHLVAGLAPSGASDRPGFGWFFDGDALCAARALAACGDETGPPRILEGAASRQRADGKLMHELTLSAGLCDWFDDYPYAYYKAPNTPDFVAALDLCLRHSGDAALLDRLFDHAQRAVAWCRSCLDVDGLISNRRGGLAAVEAGSLAGAVRAEVYLHGMYVGALRALAALATRMKRLDVAEAVLADHAAAAVAFESFWSEKLGRYGFAHLVDGTRFDELNAYVAEPMAGGQGDPVRAGATAEALNHPDLCADWGARMFSQRSTVYDPANYNTGSVFPYLNNFVLLAQYRHGFTTAGWHILRSQVGLHDFSGRGFVPEHLIGDRCTAPERGVPHQIFSSTTIIEGVAFGLLGLEPDAFAGVLRIRPALPPHWRRATYTHLRVGATLLDLRVERDRTADGTTYHLWAFLRAGPAITIDAGVVCPPLTRAISGVVNGRELPRPGTVALGPSVVVEMGRHALERELACTLVVCEGPALLIEPSPVEEGSRSRDPRLTATAVDGDQVRWTIHGRAGTASRLRVFSDRTLRAEGATLDPQGALQCEFPASEGDSFTSHVVEVSVT